MAYEDIVFEEKEGIATITLNRPDKLNAYTRRMGQELVSAIEAVSMDDEVRVLIITGAGRGFSAGVDLSAPDTRTEGTSPGEVSIRTKIRYDTRLGPTIRALQDLDKPVIAAINGVVAGGALAMAMACDIRIASEKARFSEMYVRIGLAPSNGLTYFLPRIVGIAKALELAWTGDIIDAVEAERIGLVSRVVPHDDLMKETGELATRLAKGPAIAIQTTKRAIYKGLEATDLAAHMELEMFLNRTSRESEDAKEARRAFQEKREPVFKGR